MGSWAITLLNGLVLLGRKLSRHVWIECGHGLKVFTGLFGGPVRLPYNTIVRLKRVRACACLCSRCRLMLRFRHIAFAALLMGSSAVAAQSQPETRHEATDQEPQEPSASTTAKAPEVPTKAESVASRGVLRSPSFEEDDILRNQRRKTLCHFVCPR